MCGHQRCVCDASFPGPWCRVFSLPPTECRVTFRDGPFPVKILQQHKNLLKGIISFCVDGDGEEKKSFLVGAKSERMKRFPFFRIFQAFQQFIEEIIFEIFKCNYGEFYLFSLIPLFRSSVHSSCPLFGPKKFLDRISHKRKNKTFSSRFLLGNDFLFKTFFCVSCC